MWSSSIPYANMTADRTLPPVRCRSGKARLGNDREQTGRSQPGVTHDGGKAPFDLLCGSWTFQICDVGHGDLLRMPCDGCGDNDVGQFGEQVVAAADFLAGVKARHPNERLAASPVRAAPLPPPTRRLPAPPGPASPGSARLPGAVTAPASARQPRPAARDDTKDSWTEPGPPVPNRDGPPARRAGTRFSRGSRHR